MALKTADKILAAIIAVNREMQPIKHEMDSIIAAAQAEYSPKLAPMEERRKELEKQLRKVMKTCDDEIFGDADLVKLKHGRLVKHFDRSVKRGGKWAKDILFSLKALGLDWLIKRTESPDWDKVDNLDDDQIASIGAERKAEWKYSFELIE